jgi:hypothetical protein
MSFNDPRLDRLGQQPGGSVGDSVPTGVVVVGGGDVGGGEVGCVVGGSVDVGGGDVGGSVDVGGGEVGGSVDVGGGLVGSVESGIGWRGHAAAPTPGPLAARRQENGGLVMLWATVVVWAGVVGSGLAMMLGASVERDVTLTQTPDGSQPPPASPSVLTPSSPEPGAAPLTSGDCPKIRTSTRTQTDTAASATNAGADRDMVSRTRSRSVAGACGVATSALVRLPAPTPAYPVLITSPAM